MFVLCVVSKDKKAKCRTMKIKTQVRIKYRVRENKKATVGGGGGRLSASVQTDPGAPTQPPIQQVPGPFPGGKASRAWRLESLLASATLLVLVETSVLRDCGLYHE
jgi:hypothetical protein